MSPRRSLRKSGWFLVGVIALACGPAPGPAEAPPAAGPAAPSPAAAASQSASTDEPLPEGTYRVLLTRPEHVGARARLHRELSEMRSTRMQMDGRVVDRQSHQRRLLLEAHMEVLEVHGDGRAAKTRYVVERMEADTQQGKRALVPPDTEIIVVRKPGTPGQLRIAGKPLKDDELEAVKALLPSTLAETTDQDVFGSDVPRAVGDAWALKDASARAGFREVGLTARGPAAGTARLLERREVGGDDCLIVHGRLELDRFDLPGLPKQARTRRSRLSMQFTGAYPLDPQQPVRQHDVTISMQVEATAPKDGKQLSIAIDSRREVATRIDPLST